MLQLPRHQREAVALRDLFDFSYAQIAQHTGTPEGTVRSRIHRGRTSLAELLKPRYGLPGVESTGRRQVHRPSAHRGTW
jgi:RNA polymerase sigma-70 factor (ECF subfamily)